MKTSLTLRLRGGLGNQLFQATAGVYYARKLSSDLFLDDVAIIRHRDATRRSWLRYIDVNGFFDEFSIHWKNQVWTNVRSFLQHNSDNAYFLGERDLDSLEFSNTNITIHDWFQNGRYIPKERLVLDRRFLRNVSREAQDFAKQVFTEESAAIHVRLGDFIGTSWGTLSRAWYQKSLDMLVDRGVRKIHCFSDSVFEARKILETNKSGCRIIFPEENKLFKPHELLWILTQYKTYVSSNSSLSWWAAYLNKHTNSFVISPWGDKLHRDDWYSVVP